MANPFEVTPADPMGALNAWKGELADTAYKQSRAKREEVLVGEEQDKAASTHDSLIASRALQGRVEHIDPALEPMKKLSAIADAAMSTGMYSEAEKALAGMAHLAQVSSLEELKKAQKEKAIADYSEKKMKRAMELLQGVTDPDTKRMVDNIFETEFKEPSPFKDVPYSETLRKVATGTLKDALTMAQTRTQESIREKNEAAIEKEKMLQDANLDLLKARATEIREREARLGKSGGKVSTATPPEKVTTTEIIKKFYPNMEPSALVLAREEVSQEAKGILARREAPDYKAAVEKVIKENPGRFKEKKAVGWFEQGMRTFYGEGRDPKPLPAKGTKLEKGQAYTNDKGQTKTWNGESWE